MNSITIQCLSEAISPITHASGTVGNESIVAREPVRTPRGVVMVPFLSGNALRHRAVRQPGVIYLIDELGLRRNLSLMQLNFLLHGGNLTQSTAHENTKRIAEMHALFPLLKLCGGSLPDQILSGSLHVWRGTMICEENRQSLQAFLDLPLDRLLSAEAWLGGYQYTRGDGKKTGVAQVPEDEEGQQSNLMIYSGQAVQRGAMFAHGFVLQHAGAVEVGALLWSLMQWQHSGGTIGGNSRLGHGRLHTELVMDASINAEECVEQYLKHVAANKEACVAWLQDAFAAKAEKPKKGKSK